MSITDRIHLRRTVARWGVLVAVLPVAIGGALASAPSAQADASGCSYYENVCIAAFGSAGQDVTIEGYAEVNPFHGHFEVSGPNGYFDAHPNDYWDADPGDHDTFTVPAAATGNYCIAGYDDQGNYQGAACETVN